MALPLAAYEPSMRNPWRQIPWSILVLSLCAPAQVPRGVSLPPSQPAALQGNGAYYALVIGINAYPHWPPLKTAAGDAQALDQVLRQRYGFRTTLLVDDRATRAGILNAFGEYRRSLRSNDNLLIYYAGHGARDGDKAYWLPFDSDPDSTANWIIADEITKGMQVIPARHILVISDSCYSGGLSRAVTANTASTDRARYLQTMIESTSRVLISSGRDEPVADNGSNGHSVFANALLTGLRSDPEPVFTAQNLFSQYVQEAVIGGSQQVPLYQLIQDSGHQFGDFVFVARSSAVPGGVPAPPPDRRTATPPAPAGKGLPPHKTTMLLGPDGRANGAAPADPTGALPLTDYRIALLEFRDLPQTLSDAYVADIAKYQINGEQQLWIAIDRALAGSPPPGIELNPHFPKFIFEWQKEAETNPSFASNALLPVFLRPDPDWSFLKHVKGWDEQLDSYVYVFLFDHEKIAGRQPEFAAREQAPILKKQILLEVAKAPTNLYIEVPVKSSYNLDQAAIQFFKDDGKPADGALDLLRPVEQVTFVDGPMQNLTAPADRAYHFLLPTAARATADYLLTFALKDVPLARPGVPMYGDDPQQIWRKSIAGNTFNMRAPPLGGFALDRQLKLSAVPLDLKRAEPIVRALSNLHARIYFSAGRMDYCQIAYERQLKPLQGLLFAHLLKVELRGPDDELISTVPAASFPLAGAK